MNINKVILVGRLGQDADITATQNAGTIVKLSLATSYGRDEKQVTTWHNIVVFGKAVEWVSDFKKGLLVYVEGRISVNKYQKGDGSYSYHTSIVATTIKAMEKRQNNQGYNNNNNQGYNNNNHNNNNQGNRNYNNNQGNYNNNNNYNSPNMGNDMPPDDLPF